MRTQATRLTDIAARRNRIQAIIFAPFAMASMVLFAYAVAALITPGKAQATEMMRTSVDTFYCDNPESVMEAGRRILSDDFAGFVAIVTSPGCAKAPQGTELAAGEEFGRAVKVAMYGQGGEIIIGYMDGAMLEPAPGLADVTAAPPIQSAFTLTQVAYVCREAIAAELYQSRLEVGDVNGAVALIKENGCAPVQAGEMITTMPFDVNDMDNILGIDRPVYAVKAPVGGMMVDGFIPKAQVR